MSHDKSHKRHTKRELKEKHDKHHKHIPRYLAEQQRLAEMDRVAKEIATQHSEQHYKK